MDFIVVDIETTGLSRFRHKITEIAALKYSDGEISDEFVTLIDPQVKIPRFITRLTGITNEMVEGKHTIDQVIPEFNKFLGDNIFVGHNASFDYNFLDYASQLYLQKPIQNDVLCTCKLARRLVPHLPSKNLATVCNYFHINNITAHRAKSDVLATIDILKRFLQMLEEKNIKEKEDIIKFQKSKIPRKTY